MSSFVVSSHPYFLQTTTTTVIYTLSLHDALPISGASAATGSSSSSSTSADGCAATASASAANGCPASAPASTDRKSTRLNSSHVEISYAVFCLKKKINHKYRIYKYLKVQ